MFSREQENSLHVFNISCDESYWRSHQKIIVTRSKYSHEDIVDLTASLVDAKDSEEAVGVETVQNTQEYCSLANTVFDWEDRGEWSIPSDISVLVHVDVKKESHKDGREASINKFLEQETVLYQLWSYPSCKCTPRSRSSWSSWWFRLLARCIWWWSWPAGT